tara:strand:- start:541 stop:1191 length:651 start_codon:yes stop_codon:yes gene_type:complete
MVGNSNFSRSRGLLDKEAREDFRYNLISRVLAKALNKKWGEEVSINILEALLSPLVLSDIDYEMKLKFSCENDEVYKVWLREALNNSVSSLFFKKEYLKIKLGSGYMDKRFNIAEHAIDNGALNEDLIKIFVSKSSKTIKRKMARSAAAKYQRIASGTPLKEVYQNFIIALINAKDYEVCNNLWNLITKENVPWVLPAICEVSNYHANLLRRKFKL